MDIVHELIEMAKARIAERFGLPDEVADVLNLLEAEFKHAHGGVSATVHKPRPDVEAKAASVTRDYLAGVAERDIQDRHGISRATMYRYLKRR